MMTARGRLGGRPKTEISDDVRERVLALRRLGVPVDDIPRYVPLGQYLVRKIVREASTI